MASSMEKKITELEMGLLHLQQNIDIPEITLTVHPTVAHIIKKASETTFYFLHSNMILLEDDPRSTPGHSKLLDPI